MKKKPFNPPTKEMIDVVCKNCGSIKDVKKYGNDKRCSCGGYWTLIKKELHPANQSN